MGKLKVKQQPIRLQKESRPAEYPSFSLKTLTSDKECRLERLQQADKNEYLKAMETFIKLMENASAIKWSTWFMRGKKQGGLEQITRDQICRQSILANADDDKNILSVRFGNGDAYRLIGYKDETTFYILGFDLDHSVYDHG